MDNFSKKKLTETVLPSSSLTWKNDAAQKKLKITFADEQMELLKRNEYKLCFARKIENFAYNIVWKASSDFMVNTVFRWIDEYYLFASDAFAKSVNVNDISTSNLVNIHTGEQSTLNSSGILSQPSSSDITSGFTINNASLPIHAGISQVCFDKNQNLICSPVFLSETEILPQMRRTFVPDGNLLVWLDADLETGIIFQNMPSQSIEIDFSKVDEAVINYTGVWEKI